MKYKWTLTIKTDGASIMGKKETEITEHESFEACQTYYQTRKRQLHNRCKHVLEIFVTSPTNQRIDLQP